MVMAMEIARAMLGYLWGVSCGWVICWQCTLTCLQRLGRLRRWCGIYPEQAIHLSEKSSWPMLTRAMRRRATHVNKVLHGTAIQKGIRSDVCLLPRRSLLCLRLSHSYTTLEMYSMRAMCRRERIASIKRVILPVVPRLPKAPPRILPSSVPSCGRSFHST